MGMHAPLVFVSLTAMACASMGHPAPPALASLYPTHRKGRWMGQPSRHGELGPNMVLREWDPGTLLLVSDTALLDHNQGRLRQ
jgi:hypothetical protein